MRVILGAQTDCARSLTQLRRVNSGNANGKRLGKAAVSKPAMALSPCGPGWLPRTACNWLLAKRMRLLLRSSERVNGSLNRNVLAGRPLIDEQSFQLGAHGAH
jgi:hypothetical protein